jgi:hypothetical protein
MRDMFMHDSFNPNKKLQAIKKFESTADNFYDMYKSNLAHTDFYWNEKGLRRGNAEDDILDTQFYNLNSLGYRSREFSKDIPTNTLMFGCSTSFGQGVPEDQTWASQLAKFKNIEILNMGIPGMGVARYLEDLLLYCNEFGKPKNVIVLVPDLFRLRFMNDIDYHLAEGNDALIPGMSRVPISMEDLFLNNWDITIREKYIKIPFDSKHYISPYYGVYQNLWSMYAIESFCRAAGINLFWSTYNNESKIIIQELLKNKNFFQNFLIDDDLLIDENKLFLYCKQSHNNPYFDTDNWVFGTDRPWQGRKHPGIHLHTHIAEFFNRHLEVDSNGNLYKILHTEY